MTKNNFIVLTFTIKLLLMKQLIYCKLWFINYCRTNRKMLNTGKYLPEFKFVFPFVFCQFANSIKKNWADYNISNYISLNTIVFWRIQDGTELFPTACCNAVTIAYIDPFCFRQPNTTCFIPPIKQIKYFLTYDIFM